MPKTKIDEVISKFYLSYAECICICNYLNCREEDKFEETTTEDHIIISKNGEAAFKTDNLKELAHYLHSFISPMERMLILKNSSSYQETKAFFHSELKRIKKESKDNKPGIHSITIEVEAESHSAAVRKLESLIITR